MTFAYLVITVPLYWRSEWTVEHTLFFVAHVVAAASLWWAMRGGSRFEVRGSSIAARTSHPEPRTSNLSAFLPLLLVPLLYAELPHLMGDGAYRDPLVQFWEASLFGGQPARTLAGSAPSVALSELLHLGYLLFYPIVYVPPLIYYLAGDGETYGRALLTVMLTYALCYLVFVAFPVEGPRYAYGPPADVPNGPIRALTLTILERGSSRGTAFPSSHAAVAAAQALVAFRYRRRLGAVVAVTSMLLMFGAVYGGFHYAVDVLVGAVLGACVAVGVAFTLRRTQASSRFTSLAR